jgi:hypothetical protein
MWWDVQVVDEPADAFFEVSRMGRTTAKGWPTRSRGRWRRGLTRIAGKRAATATPEGVPCDACNAQVVDDNGGRIENGLLLRCIECVGHQPGDILIPGPKVPCTQRPSP